MDQASWQQHLAAHAQLRPQVDNALHQLVAGLPSASTNAAQAAAGPREDADPTQYLHSLLSSYGVAQPTSAGAGVGTTLMIAQSKPPDAGDNMQALLQSTLTAALAGSVQPGIAQVQHTQLVVQQPQPMPAVAPTDAVQLAALLAALQDPQGQAARYTPGRATLTATSLGPDPSSGRVSKQSSSGGDVPGGGYGAREKNRQAQQRFRQRQKDRIKELEDMNKALQHQLAESDQVAAELREENKLLRAKLEGKLQLLESFQQVQQAGLGQQGLPGMG